jgi:hypothetical protein
MEKVNLKKIRVSVCSTDLSQTSSAKDMNATAHRQRAIYCSPLLTYWNVSENYSNFPNKNFIQISGDTKQLLADTQASRS